MSIDIKSKTKLEDYISSLDIDTSVLDSYKWDSNPNGVEPELVGSSGAYVWDEEEEYEAQKQKFYSELENLDLEGELDIPNELKPEIKNWLEESC